MKKVKNYFNKSFIIILFLIILFSSILLVILNRKAMPIIISYANVQTKRIGIEVLRNAGTAEVNEFLKDSNLFKITKNNSGEIESIDLDASIINEALLIVSKNVRKRLREIESGKNLPEEIYTGVSSKKLKKGIIYEVPIGVVFGNSFLSNIGPKIPVKIKYSGNVGLDVKTKVSEYGINSALIEVFIYVEVTQRTILPFNSKDIKLTSEIPIVMKIVKGTTPYYLSDIKNSDSLQVK